MCACISRIGREHSWTFTPHSLFCLDLVVCATSGSYAWECVFGAITCLGFGCVSEGQRPSRQQGGRMRITRDILARRDFSGSNKLPKASSIRFACSWSIDTLLDMMPQFWNLGLESVNAGLNESTWRIHLEDSFRFPVSFWAK